ncbi:glycosyltransferase [Barnesiella viscericola]|uniref:glycosyltransferase n=1 Tax=Barnesiella viscericola TaxID=397865 RepID=UPI0023523A93|nr:glycosyltransferase [Barnesiella viscericola]
MKLLFLTTYNVSLEREHFFTKNVWKELSKLSYANLSSILFLDNIIDSRIDIENRDGRQYYLLKIPQYQINNKDYILNSIVKLFEYVGPDIVHSNMIEGYDIVAAKSLNIPIVLTIHIGGFICPRGGGNGFLMYDDSICNRQVGSICMKCGCMDLPLPYLSYALLQTLPKRFIRYISTKTKKHNLFYVTPLINKYMHIFDRVKYIQLMSYAHVIAANHKLVYLLEKNAIPKENIHLLPHGVKRRDKLPLPACNGKVKFYYLGRIQYSKGLHILMKSLEGIDKSKYELHIIGDAESRRKEQRYYSYIRALSKNKSVIFHGRLPNERIEEVIQDCHVMVHPTICLEIYGIAIAESLSMGRPVLATKCGGAEMQVRDGYNGWLINPNSVVEMRNKIIYIINHFDEVRACAERARLPHSIELYGSELQCVYKNLMQSYKVDIA